MTTRQGRRKRKKRHKRRMLLHPVRTYSFRLLGQEFHRMISFRDEPQNRATLVGGPEHGRVIALEPGQQYYHVAQYPPVQVYPPLLTDLNVRTFTYKLWPWSRQVKFYEGRNKRTQKLTPEMKCSD